MDFDPNLWWVHNHFKVRSKTPESNCQIQLEIDPPILVSNHITRI